jgi:hypothetical protein
VCKLQLAEGVSGDMLFWVPIREAIECIDSAWIFCLGAFHTKIYLLRVNDAPCSLFMLAKIKKERSGKKGGDLPRA